MNQMWLNQKKTFPFDCCAWLRSMQFKCLLNIRSTFIPHNDWSMKFVMFQCYNSLLILLLLRWIQLMLVGGDNVMNLQVCRHSSRHCGATFNWIVSVWMFACHARARWPNYVLWSHFLYNLFQCLCVWRTVSSHIARTRKKIITINSTHYIVNAFILNKIILLHNYCYLWSAWVQFHSKLPKCY